MDLPDYFFTPDRIDPDEIAKGLCQPESFIAAATSLEKQHFLIEGDDELALEQIYHQNKSLILAHIRSDSLEESALCLSLMLSYEDESCSQILTSYTEVIVAGLQHVGTRQKFIGLLQLIITRFHPKPPDEILVVLEDLVEDSAMKLLDQFYLLCEGKSFDKKLIDIKRYFTDRGIDVDALSGIWAENGANEKNKIEIKNLLRMYRLEHSAPGLVKGLTDSFGIKNFARYPIKLLLDQYANMDNTEVSYGVIINPLTDHNGAFHQKEKVFEDLYSQLNGDSHIRIVECASGIGLIKALIKLDKKYGSKHKISFAIMGGHGSEEALELGSSNSGGLLHKDDLNPSIMGRIRGFLAKEATIVLSSCSTGAENGFAQTLSASSGLTVIGPETPVHLTRIIAHKVDDVLTLDATYDDNQSWDDASKGKYRAGERLQ